MPVNFSYNSPSSGPQPRTPQAIPQLDLLQFGARMLSATFARTLLASCFNLRIDGRENLPAKGGFVMVANHASHLDASCLMAALPLPQLRRAYPAAAADYFFSNPVRGALARLALNALPFARDRNVRQSLRLCHAILDAGSILIIFPEGTRSTTGAIGRFKPGIGQIVAGRNVPVVPCHIEGAGKAWPKKMWLPRPCKLRVAVGRPLNFAGLASGREAYDEIARQLEAAVRALAGEG